MYSEQGYEGAVLGSQEIAGWKFKDFFSRAQYEALIWGQHTLLLLPEDGVCWCIKDMPNTSGKCTGSRRSGDSAGSAAAWAAKRFVGGGALRSGVLWRSRLLCTPPENAIVRIKITEKRADVCSAAVQPTDARLGGAAQRVAVDLALCAACRGPRRLEKDRYIDRQRERERQARERERERETERDRERERRERERERER